MPLHLTQQEIDLIMGFKLPATDESTISLIKELRSMGELKGSDYLVAALRLMEEYNKGNEFKL